MLNTQNDQEVEISMPKTFNATTTSKVELIPGSHLQECRVIPGFQAQNNDFKKIIKNGLSRCTVFRTMSPWQAPDVLIGRRYRNL